MRVEEEQPELPQDLAEFWMRLNDDGCDSRHIHQMVRQIQREQTSAVLDAARLFYTADKTRPLSALDICDALDELRCKAEALDLALLGARREAKINGCGEALTQQAGELVRGLERLQRAVTAELRVTDQAREDR